MTRAPASSSRSPALEWHPHLHLLTTDGGKTADGSWQPLPEWNATLLMILFRERLLARLVEAHAISPELVKKLLAWKHPGFSAHVGEPIAPTDKLRLEDTAAYLVHNPLSLKKLACLDGERAVIYRVRGSGHPDDREAQAGEAPEPRKRCSPTWARLIARVYQTDPLVCTRCGQRMTIGPFRPPRMAQAPVGPADYSDRRAQRAGAVP